MVPFFFFSFLAAIIIVPQYLRYRDRARLHETLRLAFERNQPIPPELMDALISRPRAGAAAGHRLASAAEPLGGADLIGDRAERDLRRGVVLLAVGGGLAAMGGAFYFGLSDTAGGEATFGSLAAAGAIPAFIGLAFLALWALGRRRTRV